MKHIKASKRVYIAVAPDALTHAILTFPFGTDIRVDRNLKPGTFQRRMKRWRKWF